MTTDSVMTREVAAVLARKSTDQPGVVDADKSVAHQVEQAKAYAARHGWVVDERYIFVDDGVSGAEFVKRPGLIRLLGLLTPPCAVSTADHERRIPPRTRADRDRLRSQAHPRRRRPSPLSPRRP